MSKYIDSEKLLAEIARRKKQDVTFRERSILIDMENAIESLQQEQPELPEKYQTSDWLFEELKQQDEDLEKFTEKIKTFQARYKHPEIVSIKGAMAFMARMFYQYPNAARLWYEQLPKATMD